MMVLRLGQLGDPVDERDRLRETVEGELALKGAVDFVPGNPSKRVTIFIKNGVYEEIVFFRNKANLTFHGEDRNSVVVGYSNNSGFNPPQPGPNT